MGTRNSFFAFSPEHEYDEILLLFDSRRYPQIILLRNIHIVHRERHLQLKTDYYACRYIEPLSF